ncbi:class Ib ribonucleoside-diphosphate reductase assembly flavoprotein NrdI, partial [Klebsiella pneumoniae]
MSLIVYFSSRSENTHRFVQRLGLPAVRIPLNEREHLRVDEPYILIVPSYGGGKGGAQAIDHIRAEAAPAQLTGD